MTIRNPALATARRVACGLTALLAAGLLAACSSSPAVPLPSLSPGHTSSKAVQTPPPARTSPSRTARPAGHPTSDGSASPSPTRTRRHFPAAAPATGGGGTAGLQDAGLLALGGFAILAGAGSLVYRRRSLRAPRS